MQYIHLQHLLFQKLFSTKQTTNTSTQLTPHISFPSNQTSVFFVFQAHGNSSGIVHSCRFRMDMELCPEPLSLTSRLEVAPISVPCFFFVEKKNDDLWDEKIGILKLHVFSWKVCKRHIFFGWKTNMFFWEMTFRSLKKICLMFLPLLLNCKKGCPDT